MEEIQRMQDNLLLIRRALGWTAEEFGEQIGVTRQTINNIESGRNKLTKTQYIAMRSVIEAEMAINLDETEMVRTLLDMQVDHPENYSEDERTSLLGKANMVSPSILAGTASRETVSKEWMNLLGERTSKHVAESLEEMATKGWLSKVVITEYDNNSPRKKPMRQIVITRKKKRK